MRGMQGMKDDFQKMLEECVHIKDLIDRPYEFICHPKNEEFLRKALEGRNDYVLQVTSLAPEDKVILMDRYKNEKMMKEYLYPKFEV